MSSGHVTRGEETGGRERELRNRIGTILHTKKNYLLICPSINISGTGRDSK
jgi:hypothetical protein